MKKNYRVLLLVSALCLQSAIAETSSDTEERAQEFIPPFDQQLKPRKKTLREQLDQAINIAEKALIFTFFSSSIYMCYRWIKSNNTQKNSTPVTTEDISVDLNDYIGGAPQEIKNIAHFYKNPPDKFNISLGGGVLLHGDPGTGKTFLAKALAGELKKENGNVVFFQRNATEFCSKYVGSGEGAMRELFAQAKALSEQKKCPAVIFIDEIDAIGAKRNEENLNKSQAQVLMELLNQLDGFKDSKNIFVIAATNRLEDLDEALIREGRLGRKIEVTLPPQETRKQLFECYLKKHQPFQEDIDLDELSSYIISPASIQDIVKQAAENAAVENAECITFDHIMNVITNMSDTPQKESSYITQEDKITFKNIKGHIPQQVSELVHILKNPSELFNVQPDRGFILAGAPGSGKTLLAQAIAGELDLQLITASATQFCTEYVGSGPKAIRELFENAKKIVRQHKKKVIVFIDEIDALGKKRNPNGVGVNRSEEQALNQLLVQLDGVNRCNDIIVIGATNLPECLDPALIRSERLKLVQIPLPDKEERIEIFNYYLDKHQPHDEINVEHFAETELSPADIAAIINQAARTAAIEQAASITEEHIANALEQRQKDDAAKNSQLPLVTQKMPTNTELSQPWYKQVLLKTERVTQLLSLGLLFTWIWDKTFGI